MAKIPDSVKEEILSKADIESVVGRYVSFTKTTGSNRFGLCPFHSEKTPSFSVAVDKGIYHCFGCGKTGNSISFIMEIEKLSYPEAVRFLASSYGVTIPETSDNYRDDGLKKQKDRVYELLTEAARFYYSNLISRNGKVALDYAHNRELLDSTLRSFGIGYAPDGWDNLRVHLLSKGYTEEEMKNSGLFTVSKKNGKLFDLFRGRLVFPIFDTWGKIIAFGGRNLGPELPKYVNSPDSIVYNKQEHLYALNFAKKSKSNQLIIVEGYMDAIAMHQAGFTNAVASLGTAFTDSQLRLAAKYAEEIVFFFDSDNAGQKAAIRAIEKMLRYLKKMTGLKIRIKIALVPDGKDPDEYIKKNGKESFESVVRNAKDVDDYLFERAYNDNCAESGALDLYKFQEDIILYASWINDDLKREKISTHAATYLGVNSDTLLKRINDKREVSFKEMQNSERLEIEKSNNRIVSSRSSDADELEENTSSDEDISDISIANENQRDYSDIAYLQELNLFVYAVSLKSELSKIDREDVLRTSDFAGKNMKKIVEFFLKNYDAENGINEALLIDELSNYVLNGQRAEEVYLSVASNLNLKSPNLRDEYLSLLYSIRSKHLSSIEKALFKKMASMNPTERESIKLQLRKISAYKMHIEAKGAKL